MRKVGASLLLAAMLLGLCSCEKTEQITEIESVSEAEEDFVFETEEHDNDLDAYSAVFHKKICDIPDVNDKNQFTYGNLAFLSKGRAFYFYGMLQRESLENSYVVSMVDTNLEESSDINLDMFDRILYVGGCNDSKNILVVGQNAINDNVWETRLAEINERGETVLDVSLGFLDEISTVFKEIQKDSKGFYHLVVQETVFNDTSLSERGRYYLLDREGELCNYFVSDTETVYCLANLPDGSVGFEVNDVVENYLKKRICTLSENGSAPEIYAKSTQHVNKLGFINEASVVFMVSDGIYRRDIDKGVGECIYQFNNHDIYADKALVIRVNQKNIDLIYECSGSVYYLYLKPTDMLQ